jgi:hypothetical protein
MELRLASVKLSSCLSLLNVGIIDVYHHAQLQVSLILFQA